MVLDFLIDRKRQDTYEIETKIHGGVTLDWNDHKYKCPWRALKDIEEGLEKRVVVWSGVYISVYSKKEGEFQRDSYKIGGYKVDRWGRVLPVWVTEDFRYAYFIEDGKGYIPDFAENPYYDLRSAIIAIENSYGALTAPVERLEVSVVPHLER